MKTTRVSAFRVDLPPADGPCRFLFTSTDFNSCVTVGTAEHPPRRVGGWLAAPGAPGLGLAPRPDVLGEPVLVVE